MNLPLTLLIVASMGATAAQAQETDKKQNPSDPKSASLVLPFQLESNRTYDFRATCEKSGAANDATTRPDARLHYRLTPLRDNAGGGYNISVMIDIDAGASHANASAKNEAKAPDDAKKNAEKKKAESVLGKDLEARKTMTVQVDSTGKITSVKGLEDLRAHLATEGTPADLSVLDAVRMHVSLILGSGLHGPTLEKGQVYEIAGFDGAATPTGNVPATLAADAAKADKDSMRAMTANLKLRFDGASGDLARFTIINSMAPQTAIGDAKAKPAAGDVGTATYNVTDGLVQSIVGRMDSGAAAVTRFNIERVSSDAKSEPPR